MLAPQWIASIVLVICSFFLGAQIAKTIIAIRDKKRIRHWLNKLEIAQRNIDLLDSIGTDDMRLFGRWCERRNKALFQLRLLEHPPPTDEELWQMMSRTICKENNNTDPDAVLAVVAALSKKNHTLAEEIARGS